MNTKTLLLLLLFFLALCGVAFIPMIQKKTPMAKIYSEILFQEFTKDSTIRVNIKHNENDLELTKQSEVWKIASYSASSNLVEAFFSALQESKAFNLVSKNEANVNEYDVASDSGTFLTLKNSQQEKVFIIGKEGPESGSFYAKVLGSNNVYLIKGPLKEALKVQVDDWRNKTVVNISSESIESIETSNGIYWKKENIKPWFSPLEGREFLTEAEVKIFDSSKQNSLVIKDKNKNTLAELFFIEKEGDYWMKRKDNTDILKISGYKLQDFFNQTL